MLLHSIFFALAGSRFPHMISALQQISDPYVSAILLGLFYGLTFCTSVCLPYVVSYIAGIGAGFKKGVVVTTIYNSGRIAAYAVIGGVTGLLRTVVSEEFFLSYQNYASIAFGAAILFIGASILLRKPKEVCMTEEPRGLGASKFTQRFDVRAFSMGFTRGMILCPPLIALLLYAVTFTEVNSIILAVLFGLGTAISPLIFLGGATGWLLNRAPLLRKWIVKIGGTLLIVLGLSILLNTILTMFNG
jgi:sulfite exporter TauE/SafE